MVEVEKRRYKITGFRDLMDGTVRVILTPADIVKTKRVVSADEMLRNPFGFAQEMMNNQMTQMVHDTFLISKEEYLKQKFVVGEVVIVTISKEK
jgi:hypothetical protein